MKKRISPLMRAKLHEERRAKYDILYSTPATWLADIRNVGPAKPLGFLPESRTTDCGFTLEEDMESARSKGLRAEIMYGKKEGVVIPGIRYLMVWDEPALAALLKKNAATLQAANNYPHEPMAFIDEVFYKGLVPERTELYDLIADAFGDYRNPSRLYLGKPPHYRHGINACGF